MAYTKKLNNRIQDPNQINYVKSILEASAQQCQNEGMYSPEIYQATAQNMADTYSAHSSSYPRITFGNKEQQLKDQNSVQELTATIGDKTSTSYFLIKDSLPQGTKASQEQLTYYRPDVVSNRIATSLGIVVQPFVVATPTIPPIPPISIVAPIGQGIPNPIPINSVQPAAFQPMTQPGMSKVEILAQQMAQVNQTSVTPVAPVQTAPNPALDNFAAMDTDVAKGAFPPVAPTMTTQAIPSIPNMTAPNVVPVAPVINQNPYAANNSEEKLVVNRVAVAAPMVQPLTQTKFNANAVAPMPVTSPVEPMHNQTSAQNLKGINQNLQAVGNFNQMLGKALKDMSRGEINPIQLCGDTLNIIGNFMNGIPKGIHEARLQKIGEQMKLIQEKRIALDGKMDLVGDNLMSSQVSPNTIADATAIPAPKSQNTAQTGVVPAPTPANAPVAPASTSTEPAADPMTKTIDDLLKSNVSIDDKLTAIEKTLDKMLEQLIQIEKNLEAIQASLEVNKPQQNQSQNMVLETEVKTQVNDVINNPDAEVPVITEINTEITAEAKTQIQAEADVEVPQFTVAPTPDEQDSDIARELMNMIAEYEGDLDSLNKHLMKNNLVVTVAAEGKSIMVSEVNGSIVSPILTADANGEGWNIDRSINDTKTLELMENFVEAEELAQNSFEQVDEQEVKAPMEEDFCIA
ncbi:MAG: hypothetical protein KME09_21135 [Pleurocapsa minor HA4230-MV1]|jgi:hypothetical protein|nr:hypothetical protein [Pleurocapsa minor HA4230-MV1]